MKEELMNFEETKISILVEENSHVQKKELDK